MFRTAACLLLVAASAACSSVQTYEGPERDDSQLAFVIPENHRNRQREAGPLGTPKDGGKVVVRIGGKQLSPPNDRFAVLPGSVTVSAIYIDARTPYPGKTLVTRPTQLTFKAVAGHTYAVRGKVHWPRAKAAVTLWIVDGATGRSVASAAVPESKVIIKTDPGWVGSLY